MFFQQASNLPSTLFKNMEIAPTSSLFFDKKSGGWVGLSWQQVARKTQDIAKFLISIGIRPDDKVMICSENRSEWAIANLAIMSVGAIVVPAYTTLTQSDYTFLIEHSHTRYIFTSSGSLADSLEKAAIKTGSVEAIIYFDKRPPQKKKAHFECYDWQEISTIPHLANQHIAPHQLDSEFVSSVDKIAAENVCCIIYTSGTGGTPKGVMLTHKSIQANISAAADLLAEGSAGDKTRFLSLLPLSHAYEHTVGLHLPLSMGANVWFCDSPERFAQDLQDVKPTIMTAVPRLYEVLFNRINSGIIAKGGITKTLFDKAVSIGTTKILKQHISIMDRAIDPVLTLLVRSKVKNRLGGRLKYFVSGGAALNPDIGRFFLSLGVQILQGYGQTEASPLISANRPKRIRIETVGPAVKGVEVKLSDTSELLVKGDCLMQGYWRDNKATAQTLIDGWLHTGDIAHIHADGYIEITGRIKDIIVNSGGDNISPSRVETILCLEPEIEAAVVFGDKRPWLCSIISPSDSFLSECLTPNDQQTKLAEIVKRINNSLSQSEKIRKFIIANEAFTVANKMLTPTLKVRRNEILKNYQNQIDKLYN